MDSQHGDASLKKAFPLESRWICSGLLKGIMIDHVSDVDSPNMIISANDDQNLSIILDRAMTISYVELHDHRSWSSMMLEELYYQIRSN